MMGPGIAAYLIVSVILFATGALGVLIRRSPLIILLALEIMLNAGNLALIAFSRRFADGDSSPHAPREEVRTLPGAWQVPEGLKPSSRGA